MLNKDFTRQIARKYAVSQEIVEYLVREMRITRGESVRFDIKAIGGKGMWKRNQVASVGNGFNEALNELVTDLCTEISAEIRATEIIAEHESDPTTLIRQPRKSENLDETIGLTPISLKPNSWWPESYGDMPDLTGSVGGLRYAYFSDLARLVIRQGLRNRIFNTEAYHVHGIEAGAEPGFFNLIVQTREGAKFLTDFTEVMK